MMSKRRYSLSCSLYRFLCSFSWFLSSSSFMRLAASGLKSLTTGYFFLMSIKLSNEKGVTEIFDELYKLCET